MKRGREGLSIGSDLCESVWGGGHFVHREGGTAVQKPLGGHACGMERKQEGQDVWEEGVVRWREKRSRRSPMWQRRGAATQSEMGTAGQV